MKKAVFLTAYDRVHYLQPTLESWTNVRGAEDWDFVVSLEPSPVQDEIAKLVTGMLATLPWGRFTVLSRIEKLGVLHHPWVGFEELFRSRGYDFVVRAEDDLVVSDDILEYFSWAAKEFEHDHHIAAVDAYSETVGEPNEVVHSKDFSPWVWGTWRDRWIDIIGPTWDHDYSTFNGFSGNQAGWDWNLNTRIFPKLGMEVIAPLLSRSNNIGVNGVHGSQSNFRESSYFDLHRDPVQYSIR